MSLEVRRPVKPVQKWIWRTVLLTSDLSGWEFVAGNQEKDVDEIGQR